MAILDAKFALLATEVVAAIDVLSDSAVEDDASNTGAARNPAQVLATYGGQVERVAKAAHLAGLRALEKACVFLRQGIETLNFRGRALSQNEHGLLEAWPTLVIAYLESPGDPDAAEAIVRHLQDSTWQIPLLPEEAEALRSSLTCPPRDNASSVKPENLPVLRKSDKAQGKLLAFLCTEVSRLAYSLAECVRVATLESLETEVRQQALEAHAEDLKHLGAAAESVGLIGLASVSRHIEENLRAFGTCAQILSSDEQEILASWPSRVISYLQKIHNRSVCSGLTQYLQDSRWPNPMSQHNALALTAVLAAARIEMNDEETQASWPCAQTESSSMTLPEDIDPELRKVLLQELQRQSADFAAAVPRLANTAYTVEEVGCAQRIAHTIKGTAGTLGIAEMALLAHHCEELLIGFPESLDRGIQTLHGAFRSAADCLVSMSEALHRSSIPLPVGQLPQHNGAPIKAFIAFLHRSVHQTCRQTHKQAELRVTGEDVLVDSGVLDKLTSPLLHVLRNAIDHGIERPEDRIRLGKNPKGMINIHFLREGNDLVVRCRDDGAGFDVAAIRRVARQQGLIEPTGYRLTEEELVMMTLLPGFSTRDETTLVSGRGIGMDAIHKQVVAMRGSLKLETRTKAGCVVQLAFPAFPMSGHKR